MQRGSQPNTELKKQYEVGVLDETTSLAPKWLDDGMVDVKLKAVRMEWEGGYDTQVG